MKNKVLFTLAAVGSILCACTKEQTLNYNRPFSKAEFREAFKPTASTVYMNEDGQLIKINDPDDPTVNVLEELRMSQSVASMYYSTSKNNPFNETTQLSVSGYPLKAPIGSVSWSSSDNAIAVVDNNGLVTAISEGVAYITATSEGGKQAVCRVVVNNDNVTLAQAAKSAKQILATQNSSEFEAVSTIAMYEDYIATKKRDGELYSKSVFDQKMWASIENGYFRITSNDQDIKTSGGSVVPSSAAYVFHTTQDYLSYIFCNSNGKSNYMSLDQAYLVDKGKTPFDALGEILQSFFVAGSSIMTDQFKNILSQDKLNNGYGSPALKGSLGEFSGQFAFNERKTSGGTVSADDEDDMGIPAGTMVSIVDDIRYLFEDNLLTAKLIDEKITYELKGSSYEEEYVVNYYYYGRGVELFWPDRANYSQVDSIFDL